MKTLVYRAAEEAKFDPRSNYTLLSRDVLLDELIDSDDPPTFCTISAHDSVQCSYCRMHIWNRFLQCRLCPSTDGKDYRENYITCLNCYTRGRGCKCGSDVTWVQQLKFDMVSRPFWRSSVTIQKRVSQLRAFTQRGARKTLATVAFQMKRARSETTVGVCHFSQSQKSEWELMNCSQCARSFCFKILHMAFDQDPWDAMCLYAWICPVCKQQCNCLRCFPLFQHPYVPQGVPRELPSMLVDQRSNSLLIGYDMPDYLLRRSPATRASRFHLATTASSPQSVALDKSTALRVDQSSSQLQRRHLDESKPPGYVISSSFAAVPAPPSYKGGSATGIIPFIDGTVLVLSTQPKPKTKLPYAPIPRASHKSLITRQHSFSNGNSEPQALSSHASKTDGGKLGNSILATPEALIDKNNGNTNRSLPDLCFTSFESVRSSSALTLIDGSVTETPRLGPDHISPSQSNTFDKIELARRIVAQKKSEIRKTQLIKSMSEAPVKSMDKTDCHSIVEDIITTLTPLSSQDKVHETTAAAQPPPKPVKGNRNAKPCLASTRTTFVEDLPIDANLVGDISTSAELGHAAIESINITDNCSLDALDSEHPPLKRKRGRPSKGPVSQVKQARSEVEIQRRDSLEEQPKAEKSVPSIEPAEIRSVGLEPSPFTEEQLRSRRRLVDEQIKQLIELRQIPSPLFPPADQANVESYTKQAPPIDSSYELTESDEILPNVRTKRATRHRKVRTRQSEGTQLRRTTRNTDPQNTHGTRRFRRKTEPEPISSRFKDKVGRPSIVRGRRIKGWVEIPITDDEEEDIDKESVPVITDLSLADGRTLHGRERRKRNLTEKMTAFTHPGELVKLYTAIAKTESKLSVDLERAIVLATVLGASPEFRILLSDKVTRTREERLLMFAELERLVENIPSGKEQVKEKEAFTIELEKLANSIQ